MSEDDPFVVGSALIRERMKSLQRSVRASIARSHRLDQAYRPDAPLEFVDAREALIQEFGLSLGGAALEVRKAEADIIAKRFGSVTRHYRALLIVLWHINECSSSSWRTDRRAGNVVDVLLEVHAQALLVAEEAFMLLEMGHPIAAQVRWRTIYELEAVIRVLATGGDRAARVYKVSAAAEEHRTQRKIADLHASDPQIVTYRQRVQREFDRISRIYTSRELGPYGWVASRFPTKKNRFTVADVIGLAQETVPGDHVFRSDYIRYLRASQHGHGVRASSTSMLRKRVLAQGPVFMPASGNLAATATALNLGLMRITDVLQDFAWNLFWNEESAYWSAIASMVSLDVSTEALWSDITIEPGLLTSLASVVPQGRSTWLRGLDE